MGNMLVGSNTFNIFLFLSVIFLILTLTPLYKIKNELPVPLPKYVLNKHMARNESFGYQEKKQLAYFSLQNNTNSVKTILFWTGFFGVPDWGRGTGQSFFLKSCKHTNCATATDKRMFNQSAAIIVHMAEGLSPSGLPKYRFSHQRWIFTVQESPSYSPVEGFDGVFNWTMTYRRDSDVSLTYNEIIPVSKQPPAKVNYAKNKTKLIAWVVSNCRAVSKRMDYVNELKKYIPIDIYGGCGPPKHGIPLGCKNSHCYKFLGKIYKFYLAFENSICHDFMTNKVNNAILNNMVPIGLGVPNYSELLPEKSYIDVKSFSSPKALADYLNLLDSNDTMYNEYFEWKSKFELSQTDYLCNLCEALNKNLPEKTYHKMTKWWTEGMCVNPKTYYKGIL